MKNFITAAVLFMYSAAAIGQAKLVEKVEKKGDEIIIPYSKYVLPNGLTILVHEDHSDHAAEKNFERERGGGEHGGARGIFFFSSLPER